MIIKVTFKDPDGVSECTRQQVRGQVEAIEGLSEDERDILADQRQSTIEETLRQWIKFGEYITIEFDTIARTATVIKIT